MADYWDYSSLNPANWQDEPEPENEPNPRFLSMWYVDKAKKNKKNWSESDYYCASSYNNSVDPHYKFSIFGDKGFWFECWQEFENEEYFKI